MATTHSGGPAHRVEDLKAAVSFLITGEEVATDQIGALGICASGGYALTATATDHHIKAVATVSAVDIARQFRYGTDGCRTRPSSRACSTPLPRHALPRLAAKVCRPSGSSRHSRAGPRPRAARVRRIRVLLHPRAEHPRSAKSLTWNSVDRMAFFDAFRFVSLIRCPPLTNVGREAVTA
jgi:hypothetical protein